MLYEEHTRWNERHAAPLQHLIRPLFNDRSPERRLRIGYVSPNFRDHVIGQNLLPLLREHDRRQFEILCYSDSPRHDALTGLFRGYADVWSETFGLSDEELAQRIREDGVDILLDLTLHLGMNRLLVFARQPAPVQATFAGYPGTTGLATMQYRLSDPYLDPPGLNDAFYSEETICLSDSFWCYEPLERDLAVSSRPAVEMGEITFGCLNNFCKINPPTLKLWARVLRKVERSRLVMLAGEGSHRRETLSFLEQEGIAPERVKFVPKQPRRQYLRNYHGMDIGLDTLPYNGHTTSLDSLWMGVPVVTLIGSTVVGRAGASQLTNLALPELIAYTPEQYVRMAAGLACDLPRLSQLRATLRGRMQASALMDAPRFARNIEAAYRQMWQRWCTT
jgi:predicted O-linked N-acetylglucosamine transferase (SPINDLY family)